MLNGIGNGVFFLTFQTIFNPDRLSWTEFNSDKIFELVGFFSLGHRGNRFSIRSIAFVPMNVSCSSHVFSIPRHLLSGARSRKTYETKRKTEENRRRTVRGVGKERCSPGRPVSDAGCSLATIVFGTRDENGSRDATAGHDAFEYRNDLSRRSCFASIRQNVEIMIFRLDINAHAFNKQQDIVIIWLIRRVSAHTIDYTPFRYCTSNIRKLR